MPSYNPYGTKKCEKDYDCGKNMECLANICYCSEGYLPENDYCVSEVKSRKKNTSMRKFSIS